MVKPPDPDLVEEQDEVESEGNEEGEEAQIVEVTRQIVLEGKREQKEGPKSVYFKSNIL